MTDNSYALRLVCPELLSFVNPYYTKIMLPKKPDCQTKRIEVPVPIKILRYRYRALRV